MRDEARLFLAVARRSFRRQLQYRAAALAGLVTNVFFGVLRIAVLVALFGGRSGVAGYSLADAVSYTGITQALITLLSLFGWFDLMRTVSTGEVASDLLRPMSLFRFWLAQDAGRAAAQFLLRGLSILVLYALLFGLQLPRGVVGWALTLLSLFLAWYLSFAFRFLVNLAAFWSPDAVGIGRFAFTMLMFASGFLMPLRFFPEWVQTACAFTPFPSMLNSVVEVWLGVTSGAAALGLIGVQLGWSVALTALSAGVLALGTRRLVVQGG